MRTRHKKNKKFLFTKRESEKFLIYFQSDDIETLKLGLSLFKTTKVYKHYKESFVYYIHKNTSLHLYELINWLENRSVTNGVIRYQMKETILNFTFRNRYRLYI